jgi:hypothetical protein
MTESEPLLFNLSVDDWRNLASFFVAPGIALSVAYLLGADLLKIPFVATEVPYKIPKRMLAVLAVGLCFVASFTNASWLTLRLYSGPDPDVTEFTKSFFRALDGAERDWLRRISLEPVLQAEFVLEAYDGRSDLRVFANSSRIFGTYQDCIWRFQCTESAQEALQQSTKQAVEGHHINYDLYPISEPNKLPLRRSFRDKLRPGLNFIDVFSNNSGLVGCHVKVSLIFTMKSGGIEKQTFEVVDGARTSIPYRTIPQSASFRACDQFRLPVMVKT